LISAQAVLGAIPLIAIGAQELVKQDFSRLSLTDWTILVYLALIPAYVGYAVWNWAIRHVGPSHTSAYALLVPILASVISLFTLHEPFSVISILATIGLILCLAYLRFASRPPANAENS
jgi:drug/metabolite transporter (DMT)-like permease